MATEYPLVFERDQLAVQIMVAMLAQAPGMTGTVLLDYVDRAYEIVDVMLSRRALKTGGA